MEVQELQTSHAQLIEEKLRLLEGQVAELISDIIEIKAWKSEISKHYLSLGISRTQSEALVPTLHIKQEQIVSEAITEAADNAPEEGVLTINLKQDQVMSDETKTANGHIAAQEHPDAGIGENLNHISSASTVENTGREKCEVSTLAETTSLSDKDAPIVQVKTSFCSQKSKKDDATICGIGNKHSVLENLVKSTVQFSSDKQKLVASSLQANQENDSNEKLQNKDKRKVEEKNALFASMTKDKALSQNKNVEEEQDTEDTSVTIKDKNCPTCKCKIVANKETNDSEKQESSMVEMVKKMSKEELEKIFFQLYERHQTLVDAICDSNSLPLPDDPHALLNAARNGDIEEAILLTFCPSLMEFRDEDGYTPLHLAVWSEHIKICKLLLAYNMPVNVKDNQGNTPLHFAARKGNVEICQLLLNWLAPLNASNTAGSTPLHCAVREGHAEVFYLLVSKGALVHVGDKWNNTPLHMAACNGFLEMCQLLVNQGVDVNTQNCMGMTPLHNACRAGHGDVVKYLVKRGARLSIKCKKDKTPKDMIDTVKHSDLLEWLTKWEKRINSDLVDILVNMK